MLFGPIPTPIHDRSLAPRLSIPIASLLQEAPAVESPTDAELRRFAESRGFQVESRAKFGSGVFLEIDEVRRPNVGALAHWRPPITCSRAPGSSNSRPRGSAGRQSGPTPCVTPTGTGSWPWFVSDWSRSCDQY